MLATGAGQERRHSPATTVFDGILMSTILNLFYIPVLYLIAEGWREARGVKAGGRLEASSVAESLRQPLIARLFRSFPGPHMGHVSEWTSRTETSATTFLWPRGRLGFRVGLPSRC